MEFIHKWRLCSLQHCKDTASQIDGSELPGLVQFRYQQTGGIHHEKTHSYDSYRIGTACRCQNNDSILRNGDNRQAVIDIDIDIVEAPVCRCLFYLDIKVMGCAASVGAVLHTFIWHRHDLIWSKIINRLCRRLNVRNSSCIDFSNLIYDIVYK